jgi:hypothetical protein
MSLGSRRFAAQLCLAGALGLSFASVAFATSPWDQTPPNTPPVNGSTVVVGHQYDAVAPPIINQGRDEFSCAVTGRTSWTYVITNVTNAPLPAGPTQVKDCYGASCSSIGAVMLPSLQAQQKFRAPANLPVSGQRPPTCYAGNLP